MNSLELENMHTVFLDTSKSDTVKIPIAEYQNLIACMVILDMALSSVNDNGDVNSEVLKAAVRIREIYI